MRFNRLLLLPLAVLALGVVPACSGDSDDDNDTDAGTTSDAGTDAGTGGEPDSGPVTFPDAGTDPGTSPAGTCPANAIVCETFSSGPTANGWEAHEDDSTIVVEGGRLHILTAENRDERNGDGRTLASWSKSIPAFGTQLFVRAHVFMRSLPGVFGQMGTFFVLSSEEGGFELQAISDSGFALDDWTLQEGQGWNRQGPPVTLGMAAGRWVCLEWEVRRASASATHGNARVYMDGALAHDFNPIGMRSFNRFSVGYGFVHPLGASGSETFYDNVVVSSSARIGCQ
ncbi:hypothetical protein ACLESO_08910 [Pyxidicoccus sp. 3LG]